jgi:NAD(P)H-hydrate epimerase
MVIARILHNQGRDVEVYLAAKPDSLTGDAKVNYDAAKKFGVKIYPLKKFLTDYPLRSVSKCIIVDALLGTGLSKEVRAPLSDIIDKVNKMIAAVVSVDIPSGISSDTGQILGCGVKAQYTVTFGLPKRGHLIYPGAELTGHLFIEEIGFPGTLLESEKIRTGLIQKEDICSLFPERLKYSHKGTYGHVLIVAGSKGKTGAALMAAKACLKSGAGLVTIGIPDTLVNTFQSRVTEEMILPLPDKGDGTLSFNAAGAISDFMGKDGNVLAMGPGMSVDREISNLVSLLIKESENPMVIDADGLNAIAGNTHILNEDIEKDRINSAQKFARKNACYLVLKGVPTVIAVPDGKAFINPTGNPGMSTAGAGDVLTGMISAFLAQGLSPQDAAIAGVYMHGLTGDFIAEKAGKHSLIASDIINKIPKVFKSVLAR